MTAKANSTPENPDKKNERERKCRLIALDFQEHAVTEGLLQLLEMAKAGQISGLVFAACMEPGHGEPYLFGSAGRLQRNQAEAIGAAALLQNKLATEW